jgi:arabinose-5-phosphate isomerase
MNKTKILSIAKKVLKIELKSINSIKTSFDNNFYLAVKKIYETKGKVIVTGIGKSGHIANKISATLSSTGTPSHFIHATEASHGDLGSISKNDCILALSNSGQTNELNGIINFAKRFNITLISISSNKKGILYLKSDYKIYYKKPLEACPNNLAPTSSTTIQLILGDAIAITLIKMKGFKKSHFSNLHPAGNLGKDLLKVSDIMHIKSALPLINENKKMSDALIKMTQKSFGCIGVINLKGNLIGIITDGDLRRNMNQNIINKIASEIMTKKPTTASHLTLVGEAIRIMNEKKITSLFICKKNKPIGIIHIHDLLRLSS